MIYACCHRRFGGNVIKIGWKVPHGTSRGAHVLQKHARRVCVELKKIGVQRSAGKIKKSKTTVSIKLLQDNVVQSIVSSLRTVRSTVESGTRVSLIENTSLSVRQEV